MNLWYHFWKTVLHILISLFFDVRIYGRENIPRKGSILLISNHQSFLDPPLCGMALKRDCDYMARATLFDNFGLGGWMRSVNVFPVHGGAADIKTFKTIINRLKNNRMVIIFPEGSRSYDGSVQEFKNGFELIARKSNATIIPIAIDGAHLAMPRGKKYFRMGQKIRLHYGRPIDPEMLKTMSRDDFVADISQRITQMHAGLRESLTRFAYRG